MSPQSILIISLIAGLAGLLSGTFITYSRYIKNKSYLLSQIDRAENELAHDLMDVTSGELIKTHSGKELHLILINEKNESADRFNSYEDILFDKQTAKDSASRNGESSKDAATEQLFNTNIVLLGAPGSGKTWLLNAFHKELSLMGKSDPNFDYLLEDVGNNFLFTKSERTHIAPSTPDLKSNFLYFERRSKQIESLTSQNNQRIHKIFVRDIPYTYSTNLINEIVDNDLLISSNFILLLDPISTVLTKSHYEIILNELVQTAVKKNQKIRIAVCLSKSDLFKMKKTPVQMIRMFFGDVFLHILDSPYIDKEFFSISSIGFMQNVKIVETVEDTNLWNSMKSTEPFFWLFEKTDLEEISMNGSGNILTKGNIIYPPLRKK